MTHDIPSIVNNNNQTNDKKNPSLIRKDQNFHESASFDIKVKTKLVCVWGE